MLLAALAALLGAFVQSATGFGFALVVSPALFAVASPGEAVTTIVVLSPVLSGLVLFSERRERQVVGAAVRPVLLAAAPGVVLGVLILDALSKQALQVAVGTAVLVAVALQARLGTTGRAVRRAPAAEAYPIGLLTGILTTSTTISGPPMLLWLRARGASPGELRDSLAAAFLGLNVLGALALGIVGHHFESVRPAFVALLLGVLVIGYVLGKLVFERLDERRFHTALLATAAAAGVASVVAGLT